MKRFGEPDLRSTSPFRKCNRVEVDAVGQFQRSGDRPAPKPLHHLSACRTSVRETHFGLPLVEVMGIEPDERHPGWAGTVREPETVGESGRGSTGGIARQPPQYRLLCVQVRGRLAQPPFCPRKR